MFTRRLTERRAEALALSSILLLTGACQEPSPGVTPDAEGVDAPGDVGDANADDRASVDDADAPDDARCTSEVSCGLREVCVEGRCVCAPGRTRCGATCVDLQTSGTHCGRCEVACDMGKVCGAGACACLPGRALCPATGCTSLAFDQGNCGACGRRCASTQRCMEGECI